MLPLAVQFMLQECGVTCAVENLVYSCLGTEKTSKDVGYGAPMGEPDTTDGIPDKGRGDCCASGWPVVGAVSWTREGVAKLLLRVL